MNKKSITNDTTFAGRRWFFYFATFFAIIPLVVGLITSLVSGDQDTTFHILTAITTGVLGIIVSIISLIYDDKKLDRILSSIYIVWFLYLIASGIFSAIIGGMQPLG